MAIIRQPAETAKIAAPKKGVLPANNGKSKSPVKSVKPAAEEKPAAVATSAKPAAAKSVKAVAVKPAAPREKEPRNSAINTIIDGILSRKKTDDEIMDKVYADFPSRVRKPGNGTCDVRFFRNLITKVHEKMYGAEHPEVSFVALERVGNKLVAAKKVARIEEDDDTAEVETAKPAAKKAAKK